MPRSAKPILLFLLLLGWTLPTSLYGFVFFWRGEPGETYSDWTNPDCWYHQHGPRENPPNLPNEKTSVVIDPYRFWERNSTPRLTSSMDLRCNSITVAMRDRFYTGEWHGPEPNPRLGFLIEGGNYSLGKGKWSVTPPASPVSSAGCAQPKPPRSNNGSKNVTSEKSSSNRKGAANPRNLACNNRGIRLL